MNDMTADIERRVKSASDQWQSDHYDRMVNLWAEWRRLIAMHEKPATGGDEGLKEHARAFCEAEEIALRYCQEIGTQPWMIHRKLEMLRHYMHYDGSPLRDMILACVMHDLED